VTKSSRSIYDALRLTLRAQPRSVVSNEILMKIDFRGLPSFPFTGKFRQW